MFLNRIIHFSCAGGSIYGLYVAIPWTLALLPCHLQFSFILYTIRQIHIDNIARLQEQLLEEQAENKN
jgi:hypothetical protein